MNVPPRETAAAHQDTGNAKLRADSTNPVFTDGLLSDVTRIRRTEAGRDLFRRLQAAGRTVTVEKPSPPTAPPNAWTRLREPGSRFGNDIVIAYDPGDWPCGAWPDCPDGDVVLFGRLLDGIALVAGAPDQDSTGVTLIDAYLREREDLPARVPR